jgi:RNA 2',3'-cyclic 3'-phosphodiesterase
MSRLRTFIALELDDDLRSRLVTLQQVLARTGADVKWVEPNNLHVTLLFLGEVDERALNDVCKTVANSCAAISPFALSIDRVGSFGNPRRPRTLWAGVGTGHEEMIGLHEAIEKPLLNLGCYRREDRAYTPHITIGRVRSERGMGELANALSKQANWSAGEGVVEEVVVMSSELLPEGPVYTVLSRATLGS